MGIKIIIAAHKPYDMPNDNMYLPIHVGAQGKESIGFLRDDTAENISEKNPCFCELTGLYWAWKNLDSEYIGLVHYRRHFAGNKKAQSLDDAVLSGFEATKLLGSTDIVLPKKRNYIIENLYDHYVHTLNSQPLEIAGEIIKEKHPEYYPEFELLHRRRSAHMFNMFIMKKDILDGYCTWLFDILFELEQRCKDFSYDDFQARFYGRVSELLLDVYINTNKLSYKEIPLYFAEGENLFKKGMGMLSAKLFGKKYTKSS